LKKSRIPGPDLRLQPQELRILLNFKRKKEIFLVFSRNLPIEPVGANMFSKKIGSGLTILLLSLAGSLQADTLKEILDRNIIKATIDNKYIQTYKEETGRWINTGEGSVSSYAAQFGTSMQKVRELNGNINKSFVFVPMSDRYYKALLKEGRGRTITEIDQRRFLLPVDDPNLSSRFGGRWGKLHTGLDMACGMNTIVVAAMEGRIMQSGWLGGLGYAITIKHDNGLTTTYAHNNSLLVDVGEEVKRGQIIALSGRTGRTTGHHLHFEVRFRDVALNPEDFLQLSFFRPELTTREGATEPVALSAKEAARPN
jgi:hypothetical protein